MRENRLVYEHESYLRSLSGEVNIASSGKAHFFPPANEADAIYRASAFSLTIVGKDLLTNFHRFGNSTGRLRLEMLKKDDLGMLWDLLSMRRITLAAEDWASTGEGKMVVTTREPAPVKPNARPGVLEPSFHHDLVFKFSDWLNPGPSWTSNSLPMDGDELATVAWEMEDTLGEAGDFLDSYRIDLEIDRIMDDGSASGSTSKETLCLTHWDTMPIPNPLPPPKDVPLNRAGNQPFGIPIPEVLNKKFRHIAVVESDVETPIRAMQAKLIVYFDPADRRIAQHLHEDDLHLNPPGIRRMVIYLRLRDGNVNTGRRRSGDFESLRTLMEFAGGMDDASRPGAYDGQDIVFLTLPIYGEFSPRWGEEIRASFSGGADKNILLIEIKAIDGSVVYRES